MNLNHAEALEFCITSPEATKDEEIQDYVRNNGSVWLDLERKYYNNWQQNQVVYTGVETLWRSVNSN